VVCRDASPTIEHCLVWRNQYNGISLQGSALPKLRSNIIYENDGSGIVFDTSHTGNHTKFENWVSDSLVARNNVSANSSLTIRYSSIFAETQWGTAFGDSTIIDYTQALAVDLLSSDGNGNDVYRVNENNDRVDRFGNSMQNAMFDDLSADFQSFNSCSPCIQAAHDWDNGDRADMGCVVYIQAQNEIRKRIKNPVLTGTTYTVTCDAFSHEPVSMTGSRVQFAGYFGLEFDGGLSISGATFEPTADRMINSAWKSLFIKNNAGGTIHIENSTFRYGTESSFSGQDWINAGGMVELRGGAVAELRGCTFQNGTNYGVSAHGAGSMAWVDDCTFRSNGLSAVYFAYGARGKVSRSDIRGCGSYGIFLYNTGYSSQIENNLIAQGHLYGIKLHAAPAVEILQNTIVDNAYGGIKLDANSDPSIRYNLIAGNDFAGTPIATGIVGTQIGLRQDTNNPNVNVNWFSGNGGTNVWRYFNDGADSTLMYADSLALPDNWNIGACNQWTTVSLPSDWSFSQTIADCEAGGVARNIGRSAGQLSNPGPVLGSIGNRQILEDGTLELWLGAISFTGDDNFIFSVTSSEPNVGVELTGHHLILRPAADWHGTAQITTTVTNSEGSDTEVTTLTVVSVNDPPVLTPIPDQTMAMGGPDLVLTLHATDVEGDPLTFSGELVVINVVTGIDSGHSLTVTGTTLTLNPANSFSGEFQVNVRVVDGNEQRADRREDRGTFRVVVQ
jgi:parallel beta-helix repeat protein